MGRVAREHWGPREIDLDLLLFGEHALRLEREGAALQGEELLGWDEELGVHAWTLA
jgi:hypothetical protein